ncbi:MAG TPA: hypothetical protein VGO06_15985 [Bosea sp. (in: a-proteobacteria)]|jgi:hypothetical protein|uniref:hypothetical protein n=1 Tax=Bosea sp. (in: a-proteobacteria) TaxID=1871050 RepID=UPI002E13C885|nr:hypothetical protein [Bosea sp. (in: a-proteobacteria)]
MMDKTMPPDFVAADRRHLIETLCSASGPDTVAINLITHVVEMLPGAARLTADINSLVDAIKAKRWIDIALDTLYLHLPAVDPQAWRELRDGLALLCAVGEAPDSAGPMAQAYAAIAVDLSRWLRDSAKRASTPEARAVVRRVEQRVRLARLLSTGWSALAAGESSDYAEASATTHAAALGAEIEAATAPRAVLPEPETRAEEVALDDGWRRRIETIYGHLGVGYIAAGRGWFSLIEETLEAIDASLLPEEVEAFHISDIKEKYGTLRIYTANAPDAVEAIIEIAERRSALTCDRCGDYGRVQGRGWLACRCGRHEQ